MSRTCAAVFARLVKDKRALSMIRTAVKTDGAFDFDEPGKDAIPLVHVLVVFLVAASGCAVQSVAGF